METMSVSVEKSLDNPMSSWEFFPLDDQRRQRKHRPVQQMQL